MKLLKTKTARFADVLADAGAPEVYTLWLKPAKDPKFQSFLKNNRVMTIRQSETGPISGSRDSRQAKERVILSSLNRSSGSIVIGSSGSIGTW